MLNIKKRFVLIQLIGILCSTVGCTTSISNFKPKPDQKINPVGLYVIVSDKGGSEEETAYCREITSIAVSKINHILLHKGYQTKPLNTVIPLKQVHTYIPGVVWHIDEKKIAQYANQNGCNTVLIAQYSLYNTFLDNWLDMHDNRNMVLRVWLVDAYKGTSLTENRHIYSCKSNPIFADANEQELSTRTKGLHREYLEHITNRLLSGLTPSQGN